MFFYNIDGKLAFSPRSYDALEEITEETAQNVSDIIYYLNSMDPMSSRRIFSVSDPSLLFLEHEDLSLLLQPQRQNYNIGSWITHKIKNGKVMSVNTEFDNWKDALSYRFPLKWKINIIGLGDVGGTLLIGLRLLGKDIISEIGIYSRSEDTVTRWEMEANQIYSAFEKTGNYPSIRGIKEEEVFDCDMFLFCASKNVPPVGSDVKDVRLFQFESNSQIISRYARLARKKGFKGIFGVLSDPVDLLCKKALIESNRNDDGNTDMGGLVPDQIRGYGLGVMNARATYYAMKDKRISHYVTEGRAFGPHGDGLVIADSIENYDDELSKYLTEKALNANLEVRKSGYKPYIAPALSSGALSVLATIKGEWHYSSTYMGGVYMGSKNRILPTGTVIERLPLSAPLYKRIKDTFERMANII